MTSLLMNHPKSLPLRLPALQAGLSSPVPESVLQRGQWSRWHRWTGRIPASAARRAQAWAELVTALDAFPADALREPNPVQAWTSLLVQASGAPVFKVYGSKPQGKRSLGRFKHAAIASPYGPPVRTLYMARENLDEAPAEMRAYLGRGLEQVGASRGAGETVNAIVQLWEDRPTPRPVRAGAPEGEGGQLVAVQALDPRVIDWLTTRFATIFVREGLVAVARAACAEVLGEAYVLDGSAQPQGGCMLLLPRHAAAAQPVLDVLASRGMEDLKGLLSMLVKRQAAFLEQDAAKRPAQGRAEIGS
jgi:hypothetical protein